MVLTALAALVPAAVLAADVAEPTAVERWLAEPTAILDASEVDLAQFQWIARPVIVFAETPADPRFRQQMDLLAERPDALADRDVVIIVDTDPGAASSTRMKLRPRGFMLVLMAKDGTVMLRKPFPWDVREISRSIDKMPLRQQEIKDRR